MDTVNKPGSIHDTEFRPGENKSFSILLAEFMRKYRVFFLGIVAVALISVAGIAIWSAVSNSRASVSINRIEILSDDLASWLSETDESKKAELEQALSSSLDEVLKKYPRLFAAQRAHAMKARIFEEKKEWTSAEKEWATIAEQFKTAYIAPIALQHAASAAEENGDPLKAFEYLKTLVEKYSGKSIGIPHAYFTLGRLSEDSKDYVAALASYEKLAAAYPDDDWTKLAKDRIILIKSRGLVK